MPFGGFQFERNAMDNFLKGVQYPATRDQLIDQAKDRDLPLQIISMLQRLPDREFSSSEDAIHEMHVKAA